MSKFVKNIIVEEVFEGDTVKITCRPMSKSAAMKLYGLRKGNDKEVPEGAEEFMQTEFAAHVESVLGLKDSDGVAVAWETVRDSAYFIPMLISAASKWFESSIPKN